MTYSLAMLGVSNVARAHYGLLLLFGSQGSGRWTIPVQTIFSPVISKNHKTTNQNFEMLVERDLMSNFWVFFFSSSSWKNISFRMIHPCGMI